MTGTADTRVTWVVVESGGGSVSGTGAYVAPGSAGTFHIRVASVANPSKTAQATVTVTAAPPPPVTVTVNPGTGAVDACRTLQLAATVANSSNTAVTWSVQEGAAGGTVSAAGLYTAPSSAGTYHVVATSQASATATATATITVADHILSVAVTPGSATLQANGTLQFTASVTTTCGTVTAAQSTVVAAAQ
ncbi:MAG: hypothetical protein QM767_01480 [Anaeromyxobacter sp.]